MRLKYKKCPFCGSKAELLEGVLSSGANDRGVVPPGGELVTTRETINGIRYYWQKHGYIVTCSNKSCICRHNKVKFTTLEEAAKIWNTRNYDWEL